MVSLNLPTLSVKEAKEKMVAQLKSPAWVLVRGEPVFVGYADSADWAVGGSISRAAHGDAPQAGQAAWTGGWGLGDRGIAPGGLHDEGAGGDDDSA